MKIVLESNEYEVLENVKEALDTEELKKRYTEFFEIYDYIVGDWAYGKLRLKGFYEENNKKVKSLNNIKNVQSYLKENCAYNCKYFIIKKVYKN